MRMNFTELEIRVLGSLMEKELATPESYPLTLNALASACNQKSNREPVMNLSEPDLLRGLEALGARGLARLTTTGGRVPKYCHSVEQKMGLDAPSRAVLAELMLRGPQTASELRSRGERMVEILDIEGLLLKLQQHGPPLVVKLPRQSGRKEPRYLQLLAGMPELPEEEEADTPPRTAAVRAPAAHQRLQTLEEGVGTLREEIAALRHEVEEMIAAFS